jgi:hypothetical protein
MHNLLELLHLLHADHLDSIGDDERQILLLLEDEWVPREQVLQIDLVVVEPNLIHILVCHRNLLPTQLARHHLRLLRIHLILLLLRLISHIDSLCDLLPIELR